VYALCPYAQHSSNMGRSCLSELGVQLFAIFVVKMVTDTIGAVVIPFVRDYRCGWEAKSDDTTDDVEYDASTNVHMVPPMQRTKSIVELEFDKTEYHVMMGPFGDYLELAIQFGYATIFTVAFPMAPLMAFINNYFQIRFDVYKISQTCRRPEPRGAEDLGTWQYIFSAVATIAVVSNCALIVFTSSYLKDYQVWLPAPMFDSNSSVKSVEGYKWLLFFVMEHTILAGRNVIDFLIDDTPRDVRIQMARQDLVTKKVIHDVESDDEGFEQDDATTMEDIPDMHIWPLDDDVILKQHDLVQQKAREHWLKSRARNTEFVEQSRGGSP
jgi:hypothetical protein